MAPLICLGDKVQVQTPTHTRPHTHTRADMPSWTFSTAAGLSCIYVSPDGHYDNMSYCGEFFAPEATTAHAYTHTNTLAHAPTPTHTHTVCHMHT